MRLEDIRFKAKRLDNNKWVEGDLYHNVRGYDCIGQLEGKDVMVYPIDPSTVCQYTGLKDKSGKEIWEGDVLDEVSKFGYCGGIVTFRYGAFCLLARNGKDFCIALANLKSGDSMNRFKVVGNKFDKEGSL